MSHGDSPQSNSRNNSEQEREDTMMMNILLTWRLPLPSTASASEVTWCLRLFHLASQRESNVNSHFMAAKSF